MMMVTTCPACHTRFRVTPEQMDAHGGDVRCGRCAKVFNAHVYLEHELEELQHEGQSRLPFGEPGNSKQAPLTIAPSPLAPARSVPAGFPLLRSDHGETGEGWGEGGNEEPAAPSLEEMKVEEELALPPQAVGELLPEPPVEAESFVPEWGEETSSELPAVPEPLPEPVVTVPVETVVEPVERDAFVEVEEEPKKRSFFWLWLIGVLLLLAGMGVQGLYFFRSDLAAHYPEFKPFLQQLCGVLQCSIRLPANPDLLSIETSNLEADPQQANLITLNAILRNRARFAQEYPQIELTLTDTQDRMIARRIFTPDEYAKHADLNRGMTPNEEVTVKLHLDLGDLKAAGYRVFLFYPQ